VVRELQQHVEEFRKLAPNVQAKLMGRWPSGAPLTLSPDRDRPELRDRNDFDYFARDRAGLQCPVGAHVRRANPRDAFADPALQLSAADAIASVNHHRILRRGRPYVQPEKTGMFFMCLNTNIDRQFEFVQQNWLANRGFGRLRGEQDFAVGNETSFTIPHCAGRQKLQLSAFVRVRGGGYFFLPGIRALRYLTRD
jgi:Dyp-type peroxidase family